MEGGMLGRPRWSPLVPGLSTRQGMGVSLPLVVTLLVAEMLGALE